MLRLRFQLLFLLFTTLFSQIANSENRDPESIFNDFCFACHGTGWEDAPVIGDAFAWEDRIDKGFDLLLQNTINGINSMPPKGSCDDCSDEELKAVVTFMIE